jgi:hypothetical protein
LHHDSVVRVNLLTSGITYRMNEEQWDTTHNRNYA